MNNENTNIECVICYREFNTSASSFSCSHNVLCADCNNHWTKSCPLCRSNRTVQHVWYTEQYHEISIDENAQHRDLSNRTEVVQIGRAHV